MDNIDEFSKAIANSIGLAKDEHEELLKNINVARKSDGSTVVDLRRLRFPENSIETANEGIDLEKSPSENSDHNSPTLSSNDIANEEFESKSLNADSIVEEKSFDKFNNGLDPEIFSSIKIIDSSDEKSAITNSDNNNDNYNDFNEGKQYETPKQICNSVRISLPTSKRNPLGEDNVMGLSTVLQNFKNNRNNDDSNSDSYDLEESEYSVNIKMAGYSRRLPLHDFRANWSKRDRKLNKDIDRCDRR